MGLISSAVRLQFATKTRKGTNAFIRREADLSVALVENVFPEEAKRPVRVPSMMGIDPDMQNWSLLQVLEHNTIVNRRITSVIQDLATHGSVQDTSFDPKKDTMPSETPDRETIEAFQDSIDEHFKAIAKLPKLRGLGSSDHPIFGPFDAHRWHCMFGFHLKIHRRQMEVIHKSL